MTMRMVCGRSAEATPSSLCTARTVNISSTNCAPAKSIVAVWLKVKVPSESNSRVPRAGACTSSSVKASPSGSDAATVPVRTPPGDIGNSRREMRGASLTAVMSISIRWLAVPANAAASMPAAKLIGTPSSVDRPSPCVAE